VLTFIGEDAHRVSIATSLPSSKLADVIAASGVVPRPTAVRCGTDCRSSLALRGYFVEVSPAVMIYDPLARSPAFLSTLIVCCLLRPRTRTLVAWRARVSRSRFLEKYVSYRSSNRSGAIVLLYRFDRAR